MTEREFLMGVLRENADAVDLILLLGSISQVWDDLVDRDKPVSPERINGAFMGALLLLPVQPFYVHHFDTLQPLIQAAMYDWLASNALQVGDHHDKTLAFVLRDGLVGLVSHCAYLIGGHSWAIESALLVRRFFHDEKLHQYLGEQA